MNSEKKETLMPSREQIIQRLTPEYQEETGNESLDSHRFADWLMKRGVKPPPPPSERSLLAREARKAWRQDIRKDEVTGQPYRKYHAVPMEDPQPGDQLRFYYFDIERAPRGRMVKALGMRKEQMIDNGVHITLDADHWNRINPEDEPIQIPMDLTDPIEWRKNAPRDDGPAYEEDEE